MQNNHLMDWEQLKSIVAFSLWGEKETLSLSYGHLNWESLYKVSEAQTIQGLFVDAVNQLILSPTANEKSISIPDEDTVMDWHGTLIKLQRKNIMMIKALKKMSKLFGEANIRYVVVKGQICGARWPQPLHRTPGDIDLMILPEDYDKTKRLFEKLGAKYIEGAESKHITYNLGDISWELHFTLHRFGQKKLQRSFDKWINLNLSSPHYLTLNYGEGKTVDVAVLAPELELAYLLIHFIHHVVHEGCGMRQLIDFAVTFHSNFPNCDSKLFFQYISELQLTRAFRTVLCLCKKVLKMPLNEFTDSVSTLENKLAEKIEMRMMADGNFGQTSGWHKPNGLWGSFMYNLRSLRRELSFIPLWPKEELLFPWEVISRKF